MENVSKTQQWYRPSFKRTGNFRPALLAASGLVVVLGALAPLDPPVAIVGACAVVLVALVEPGPMFIVLGLTVMLPLTGGLARGAVIPFLRVGQALVVLSFLLFILFRPGPQGRFRFTLIDLTFWLYLLTGAVFPMLALYWRGDHINLFASDPVLGSSPFQILLGPVQYYLLYRIIVATVSSEQQIKTVLKLMFIASIMVSVIGILQALRVSFVETFLQTYYPIPVNVADYSSVGLRVSSTLQHYSGLGAYLSFMLILVLCCYLGQVKISPLLLTVTTLLDSIVLILTGTFAAWIGVAVGVIVVFLIFRRIPSVFIYALITVALAGFFFQNFLADRFEFELGQGEMQGIVPQSFAYRIMLWQTYAFPVIGQHILFGSGPAPAVLANGFFVEESQYFHLLLEGGIVYLFGYLVLMGCAVTVCWRQIKSECGSASRSVAVAALAILVAMGVMYISGEYFTYAGAAQTLWTFLAIVVASSQLSV